jgi:predicted MPP superfamily phosphohydrolase
MVAGDWTYEPKRDLVAGFAPLAQLKKPVFAVLGNHDVERPGPKLAKELRAALETHGVHLMEGRSMNLNGWNIVGLDDLWGGNPEQQIKPLLKNTATSPTLILTHQPDTAALLPEKNSQLTLAGHTHGGQINLPLITRRLLQATMTHPWYNGAYQTRYGTVFVTTGTGMVGAPMRFNMPPRIDVLNITYVP